MTTLQQDNITGNNASSGVVSSGATLISPAPNAIPGIHTAGDTGANWFDFSGPAAVQTLTWEDTISSADDFAPGKLLVAMPVSPNTWIDESYPRPMASYFSAVYLQTVFERMNYELVCSKSALTNAKLAMAFVPYVDPKEIEEMDPRTLKALVDRQAEKVIFSPNANESHVLNPRWSHTTNFVQTGYSMGSFVIIIYQAVVGDSDSGTNVIHLTLRSSVSGLKLRYPATPSVVLENNEYYTKLRAYTPQVVSDDPNIRSTEESALPLGTSAVVSTPTMVILPAEFAEEILPEEFSPGMTPDGQQYVSYYGLNRILNTSERMFILDGPRLDTTPKVSTYIVRPETVGNFPVGHWEIHAPYVLTPGQTLGIPEPGMLWLQIATTDAADRANVAPSIQIDDARIVYDDVANEIVISGECKDNPISEFWRSTIATSYPNFLTSSHQCHVNFGGLPSIDCYIATDDAPSLINPDAETVVCWAQTPNEVDPELVVNDIAYQAGLPLVTSLINQAGVNNQARLQGEVDMSGPISATVVVGDGDPIRGFTETLGDIVHTVSDVLPFISLLIKAKEQAVIVEARSDSPIHYVPIGGKSYRARNSVTRRSTKLQYAHALAVLRERRRTTLRRRNRINYTYYRK